VTNALPDEISKDFSASIRPFQAEYFVRDVKALVQDDKLINCMFASNEGLIFEAEARRERRFVMFR
jgi:hypothetical protein